MEDFASLRNKLIELTKKQLGEAVSEDILIIQALASVDELTVSLNTLSKRLREWFGYILPELGHKINDHESFIRLIVSKSFDELLKEFAPKGSMGIKLPDEDLNIVKEFSEKIYSLYKEKESLIKYLDLKLDSFMPNTKALLGSTISARLLSGAGSLKSLTRLPASTIQLLGAEKALFRHLKTGARSPKYGYIFSHQLIQNAKSVDKGRVARSLADKASICVKLDFFKGDFLGEKYLKDLEAKFRK